MARSPFPGMDPYLESTSLWPDVHSSLMNIFREQLAPLLAPKYIAQLDTQIVVDRFDDGLFTTEHVLPDVTVTRNRLAEAPAAGSVVAPPPLRMHVPIPTPVRLVTMYIRLRENEKLVTVIELVSPVNKRPGEGRQTYLAKREAFLQSSAHLIEIDLLRRWPRMPFEESLPRSNYLAMVSDMYERPECSVWPISVRHPLPTLPIPLLQPDPSVTLDLGKALATAYKRARYDLRIDYLAPCDPPLDAADTAWAATLLTQPSETDQA